MPLSKRAFPEGSEAEDRLGYTGFAPCSRHVCFPALHCSGSRLLCRELCKAGPGLRALPRSKLLRFRFLGTPPRCTLGWAYVLCPSQARTAQETRCLGSTLSPGLGGVSSHLPHPSRLVSLVRSGRALSGVPCVPRRELISGCNPPGRCSHPESQKSWLATGSLLTV